MKPAPNPPRSVALAIGAFWLLAALALGLGVLDLIASWPRPGQTFGCIAWAVVFVPLTVPGLSRGHRGPRILAVGAGLVALVTGSLAVSNLTAMPGPVLVRIVVAVLGIAFVVLGAAVTWLLVGPSESRAWFRPR